MHNTRSFCLYAFVSVFFMTIPVFSQEYQGMATHFDGLGSPYGGCGVPQDLLETQNFLALNAFNTPNNYSTFTRPLTGADTVKLGEFANGNNCGRWAEVTIEKYCTGTNDGAQNQPFCRGTGAAWVDDQYSGAVLDMLVADCCPDANAWCRDSRYHLDLVTASLNTFVKNGSPVATMNPDHWNNREISWHYILAPNYSGDVRIFFIQGAQQYWPAILITHLQNGIHGVQQKVGTDWQAGKRDSDMGQAFILPGTSSTTYTIRIVDASNVAINNSREYTFDYPAASCGNQCSIAATEVTYTTADPNSGVSGGILTKKNLVRLACSKGFLTWRAPGNTAVTITVWNILGKVMHEERPVPGHPGSGSMSLKDLKAGMFVAELKANGTCAEKIVFARP